MQYTTYSTKVSHSSLFASSRPLIAVAVLLTCTLAAPVWRSGGAAQTNMPVTMRLARNTLLNFFDFRTGHGLNWLHSSALMPAVFNTITVTGTADGSLASLAGNGTCDLREAIQAANTNTAVGECTAGTAGVDTIQFNLGTGTPVITLTGQLPTITQALMIDGATGGATRVMLDGVNSSIFFGLDLQTTGSIVRSLVIKRFLFGIRIFNGGGHTIQNCFIGTNETGASTVNAGNSATGIVIVSSPNNLIGGDTAGTGNVLSANGNFGIQIQNAESTGNTVQGNRIGTDVSGTLDLGNAFGGINVSGAPNNLIGGSTTDARNVIAGNNGNGVSVVSSPNTRVQGNYIGLNAAGTAALSNNQFGVQVTGPSSGTSVGGVASGEGNVIAGNGEGVVIQQGASGALVCGNIIGLNASGTAKVPNAGNGVLLDEASGNTIGGTVATARNIISGNNGAGVSIRNTQTGGGNGAINNAVQGNFIGTDVNGTASLGNGSDGVLMAGIGSGGANNNSVGGTVTGAGNVIAFNGGAGVHISSGASNNKILGNAIFSSTRRGILLGNGDIPGNDPGDGDGGPNNQQNFPVLTNIVSVVNGTTIQGTLNSAANATFRLEFFSNPSCDPSGNGEGQVFLGATDVQTNASNTASFNITLPVPVTPGHFVTATATDANGNTSEFSACRMAPINQAPIIVPASVTRNEGQPGVNSLIATITDNNQIANSLSVTINGQPLSSSPTVTVNGVTISNPTLDAAGALQANVVAGCGATNASFTLAATDNFGVTTTSPLTITVTAAAAPIITTQPLSQTRTVGQSVSFTVSANAAALSYQWRKNGVNIAGATSNTYFIGSLSFSDAGDYDVVVSGICNSVASAVAALSVTCTDLTLSPATIPGGMVGTAYPPTIFTAAGGSGNVTFTLVGTLPTGMSFSSATLSGTPTQGGSFPFTLTATDANSCTGNQTYTLIVNRPPVALCQDITVTADATCTATADINNGSNDPDGDVLTITQSPAGTYAVGTHTVTLRVDDGRGGVSTCTATVTVNAPQPVPTIIAPVSGAISSVGAPVNLEGTFTDMLGTTHTATWQFVNGTTTITLPGSVTEPAGANPGAVTATQTFTAAGVYQMTLTVVNNCGGTGSVNTTGTDQFSALIVIYDPNAGFVTGGGWINSPAGAYAADPMLTGKANFGFVSKYQNGAGVPTGNTEFQFKAGNLNFKSSSYEWLVVAGARAQYKGNGTINNSGNYRFMLTVIDGQQPGGGGADKFRIRIWDEDGSGLVYDNQLNAPDSSDPRTLLGGGQITIHKK